MSDEQIITYAGAVRVPADLAAALVKAQASTETLRRDGKGDKGKYTTSDSIAAAASKALNDAGCAWVRTGVAFDVAGLGSSDIGNQTYAGDIVQSWMIVHESGAAIVGSSRMPVVVSRGRPHDKAIGAAMTYDVGQVLRGALCMDREGKDGIDRRQDHDDGSEWRGQQRSSPARRPPQGQPRREDDRPRCSGPKAGAIAEAIRVRSRALAEIVRQQGNDCHDLDPYNEALAELGLDEALAHGVTPEQLYVDDGKRVSEVIKRWAAEAGVA